MKVELAKPKVFDYRERYKNKQIRRTDLVAIKKAPIIKAEDTSLNRFSYRGEKLFFGEGTVEEI